MSTVGYINISLEICGSVLSAIIAVCLLIGKNANSRLNRLFLRLLVCNAGVLISDCAAWLFKGHTDAVSYWGVRISNFLVFMLGYLLLTFFVEYLTCYLGERTEVSLVPLQVIRCMCLLAAGVLIVSQFNHMFYRIDENNIYHRESWFWLSQVWGIAGMGISAGLLIRYRRSVSRYESFVLFSYIVLPVAAMCVQIFVYGIALLNLAVTFSIVIIFLFIQMEQARKAQDKELELSETRVAVMLSQIQPHFLYNSLTAIKQLCDIDPKQAKQAIVEFSNYLRGNVDALTAKMCIPIEREMEQVKNYLSLEKKRFGDMLEVTYDLKGGDFLIPPLTVQPIVENAVRHGVTKKEGGGTVTISTCNTQADYVIVVSDDGVGFDPAGYEDGRSHVGLNNVKKRVAMMCGGSLAIESRQNAGTCVTITIPKGGTGK